ncbi:hypothetical protein GQR58_013318 [Nymphon striatum]|nr:hypothetical protein GQR58_013318 [Nymphon striatum]
MGIIRQRNKRLRRVVCQIYEFGLTASCYHSRSKLLPKVSILNEIYIKSIRISDLVVSYVSISDLYCDFLPVAAPFALALANNSFTGTDIEKETFFGFFPECRDILGRFAKDFCFANRAEAASLQMCIFYKMSQYMKNENLYKKPGAPKFLVDALVTATSLASCCYCPLDNDATIEIFSKTKLFCAALYEIAHNRRFGHWVDPDCHYFNVFYFNVSLFQRVRRSSTIPQILPKSILQQCKEAAPKPDAVSSRQLHSEAFKTISDFINTEMIQNNKVMLVSSVQDLYEAEYCSLGGREDDIAVYSIQALTRKLRTPLKIKYCYRITRSDKAISYTVLRCQK